MTKLLTNNNKSNLMFLGIIVASLMTQEVLDKFGLALPIPDLLTVGIVFAILSRFNKVSYTEDKKFLNHKSELITKYPTKIFRVIMLSIATTVILTMSLERALPNISKLLPIVSVLSTFIALVFSYFIYLDCPITILFNKNAWQKHITGYDPDAKATHDPALHNNSSDLFAQGPGTRSFNQTNPLTDPSYRTLSSNIHNPNRFK